MMIKRVCLIAFLLTAVFVVSGRSGRAAGTAGSTDGVVSVLLKKYKLTETTMDKTQITHEGTELSLKQTGVYAYEANSIMSNTIDNKVVEGRIQKQGMFVSASCSKSHCHVMKSGDKLDVTKIESKNDDKGDVLKFSLVSVEEIDGGDGAKRYQTVVTFRFKKGYLAESSPEDVEAAIEAVIGPGDDSADSGTANTASNSQPAATQPAAPVQRAAPVACVAAPAAPTGPLPDLAIGERWSEVLKGYGMPSQIIDLGKKVTFIYKDSKTKVVFTDDKISAMEPL